MIEKKVFEKKQQIISEYLTAGESFKVLGLRYGVNPRTIQTWVRTYRKTHTSDICVTAEPEDVKVLKKQLEQAQLKNELLEEMLRLSEKHTGIDLRKKYGTRQS